MNEAIHLLFGANDRVARPLAAAMWSVISSVVDPARLQFHVLSTMGDEGRKRVIRSFPDTSIEVIQIDAFALEGLPGGFDTTKHVTPEMWLRVLAADLLPRDVGRVVYLDCDVIVRRNIDEIWSHPLDGHPLGAAHSAFSDAHDAGLKGIYGDRTIAGDEPYFNSGVLVCDLDQWRSMEVGKRAKELAASAKFTYPDQDVLNVLFLNDWYDFGFAWNQTSFSRIARNEEDGDAQQALDSAAIVHFTSEWKPWQQRYPAGIGRALYLSAEAHTDWAGEALDVVDG